MHLESIQEHQLRLDGIEEPFLKPKPPYELYTQLKRLPSSAYARIPDEPISVQLSENGYGIVNLERLANITLKDKFWSMLLGNGIANHVKIEQWERDPILSVANAIYDSNDSEGIEGAENYIEQTCGSPTRLMSDLLVAKMITSGSITNILVLLLNVRKILTPGHCLISDVLLQGLSLLNYLQVLRYRDRNWDAIIDQDGKVELDINSEVFERENLFSDCMIIRYLPFTQLEFNPHDYRNQYRVVDDLFDHEWEVQPFRLFLSRTEVCTFRIFRDEWQLDADFKLRMEKPHFEMEFRASVEYTAEGIAYVNPANFGLVNSILNPFKDFPLALLALKEWTEGEVRVRPMTYDSCGLTFLTFAESSEAKEKANTGHFRGVPNLIRWLTGSNRNSGFNYSDIKLPSDLED